MEFMNCNDAVEEILKCILCGFQESYKEFRLDDSDHIRSIKIIIDKAEGYARCNPEKNIDPDALRQNLYNFSKCLWKDCIQEIRKKDADEDGDGSSNPDGEYDDYYYDHIYCHGFYPE
jgi:hypothetical protein